MNDRYNQPPPEGVLPYLPNRARYPGYKAPPRDMPMDPFLEEENPEYRQMAERFASRRSEAKRANPASGMLIRFGAIVGVAALTLTGFSLYLAGLPGKDASASSAGGDDLGIPEVSRAAGPVVEAALTPVPPPAPAPVKPASAQQPAPAPVAAVPAEPAPLLSRLPEKPVSRPPREPIAPALDAASLTMLMERGKALVDAGDFASARLVYRRAAEAGYAEAALALAATYDPDVLKQKRAFGIVGDHGQARKWYRRAQELGSLEAPAHVERLSR